MILWEKKDEKGLHSSELPPLQKALKEILRMEEKHYRSRIRLPAHSSMM